MNVMVQLEFELTYSLVAVQDISYYAIAPPPISGKYFYQDFRDNQYLYLT